ncbi:hypothetical protein ABPG75_009623 [Micractinium tetrahymenae]
MHLLTPKQAHTCKVAQLQAAQAAAVRADSAGQGAIDSGAGREHQQQQQDQEGQQQQQQQPQQQQAAVVEQLRCSNPNCRAAHQEVQPRNRHPVTKAYVCNACACYARKHRGRMAPRWLILRRLRRRNEGEEGKQCTNCGLVNSYQWRRHPQSQELLCSACGAYLASHGGAMRPRALWRRREDIQLERAGRACRHCGLLPAQGRARHPYLHPRTLDRLCGRRYSFGKRHNGRMRPLQQGPGPQQTQQQQQQQPVVREQHAAQLEQQQQQAAQQQEQQQVQQQEQPAPGLGAPHQGGLVAALQALAAEQAGSEDDMLEFEFDDSVLPSTQPAGSEHGLQQQQPPADGPTAAALRHRRRQPGSPSGGTTCCLPSDFEEEEEDAGMLTVHSGSGGSGSSSSSSEGEADEEEANEADWLQAVSEAEGHAEGSGAGVAGGDSSVHAQCAPAPRRRALRGGSRRRLSLEQRERLYSHWELPAGAAAWGDAAGGAGGGAADGATEGAVNAAAPQQRPSRHGGGQADDEGSVEQGASGAEEGTAWEGPLGGERWELPEVPQRRRRAQAAGQRKRRRQQSNAMDSEADESGAEEGSEAGAHAAVAALPPLPTQQLAQANGGDPGSPSGSPSSSPSSSSGGEIAGEGSLEEEEDDSAQAEQHRREREAERQRLEEEKRQKQQLQDEEERQAREQHQRMEALRRQKREQLVQQRRQREQEQRLQQLEREREEARLAEERERERERRQQQQQQARERPEQQEHDPQLQGQRARQAALQLQHQDEQGEQGQQEPQGELLVPLRVLRYDRPPCKSDGLPAEEWVLTSAELYVSGLPDGVIGGQLRSLMQRLRGVEGKSGCRRLAAAACRESLVVEVEIKSGGYGRPGDYGFVTLTSAKQAALVVRAMHGLETARDRRLVLQPNRSSVERIRAQYPRQVEQAEAALAEAEAAWPAQRAALSPSHYQHLSRIRQAISKELQRLQQQALQEAAQEEVPEEDPGSPEPDYSPAMDAGRGDRGLDEEEEAEEEGEEEEAWEAVWRRAHASPAWMQSTPGEAGEPPLAPLLMRFFARRPSGDAPAEEWQLVSPRLWMAGLPYGYRESELIDLLTEHGGTVLYASLGSGDRGDTAVVTLSSARQASDVAHKLQGVVLTGSSHRLFIRPFHDHVDRICSSQPTEAAAAYDRLEVTAEEWEKKRRRRRKQGRTGYPTPKRRAALRYYAALEEADDHRSEAPAEKVEAARGGGGHRLARAAADAGRGGAGASSAEQDKALVEVPSLWGTVPVSRKLEVEGIWRPHGMTDAEVGQELARLLRATAVLELTGTHEKLSAKVAYDTAADAAAVYQQRPWPRFNDVELILMPDFIDVFKLRLDHCR